MNWERLLSRIVFSGKSEFISAGKFPKTFWIQCPVRNRRGKDYWHRNEIDEYLKDLPVNLVSRKFFSKMEHLPIILWLVTGYFRDIFGDELWPASSPDLTSWTFFIWCQSKSIVYATSLTTRENLEVRVRQSIQSILPYQWASAIQNTAKRPWKCLYVDGLERMSSWKTSVNTSKSDFL